MMKTKTFLTGLLLSTIILTVGQTAQAEETAQGLKKTGSANVELTSGTDVIKPDPIAPSPSTGPMLAVKDLGITSATDLYFDAISLTSATSTRDALYVKSDGTPISNVIPKDGNLAEVPVDGTAYVPGYSVTDRRGTGAGWNLTLTLGDFVEQDVAENATAHTLKGAQLSFPQVTPITSADASGSVAPTTSSPTIDAGGSAKVLMSAAKDQGMGLWEARYDSRELPLSDEKTTEVKPIQLSVPGNNYAGKYKATLTWDLADAPTAATAE